MKRKQKGGLGIEKEIANIGHAWLSKVKEKQRNNWKDMKYGASVSVSKLVAEYRLTSTQVFPYTKCKLRIWESEGTYYGYLNVSIQNDGISGMGSTIEEALDDTIKNNIELILEYEEKLGRKLTDDDYVYSDPHDF
jgi:hypothetical protein